MLWVASMVFALCVCAAVFFTGRALRAEAEPRSPEADRGRLVMLAGIVLFVVWVGGHTAFASIRQVDAGHVMLVYEFGEIVGRREEGLRFIAPWQDTRTESIQVRRKQFENISGLTKERQDVCITATLKYSVPPTAIQNLYRTVGPDWFNKLIPTRVNQFFKAEMVLFDAVDIAPNSEVIRENVRVRLRDELAQFSITVVDLVIDDIQFNVECRSATRRPSIAPATRR